MLGAAALPAISRIVRAQAYPSRPVRIVVGFSAGGPNDINARLIGQWLSERLGQQFIVDNRPGASGNIAMEFVVKSPPDGYTLVMVATNSAVNATLYDKLPFVFLRDIAPIGTISRNHFVLVVHPSLPVTTALAPIAYAKANPGQLNMGSPGSGTGPHMAGELFKMMAGVRTTNVPYRGSAPMLTDLLGGQVQFAFDGISSSIEHIRSGRLRALGVSTPTRLDGLLDVPPIGESCRATRPSVGRASVHRRARRPRSSTRSTARSAGLADPKAQGAHRRRQRGVRTLARRVRQAPRRGYGEMGQGGQVRGAEAGVRRRSSEPILFVEHDPFRDQSHS